MMQKVVHTVYKNTYKCCTVYILLGGGERMYLCKMKVYREIIDNAFLSYN